MVKIPFSQIRSEAAARSLLEMRFPISTLRPVIEKTMKDSKAKCYSEEGWLICEYKEETSLSVLINWEVCFSFDEHQGLSTFTVRRTIRSVES